jgi:hypothetical protein
MFTRITSTSADSPPDQRPTLTLNRLWHPRVLESVSPHMKRGTSGDKPRGDMGQILGWKTLNHTYMRTEEKALGQTPSDGLAIHSRNVTTNEGEQITSLSGVLREDRSRWWRTKGQVHRIPPFISCLDISGHIPNKDRWTKNNNYAINGLHVAKILSGDSVTPDSSNRPATKIFTNRSDPPILTMLPHLDWWLHWFDTLPANWLVSYWWHTYLTHTRLYGYATSVYPAFWTHVHTDKEVQSDCPKR